MFGIISYLDGSMNMDLRSNNEADMDLRDLLWKLMQLRHRQHNTIQNIKFIFIVIGA